VAERLRQREKRTQTRERIVRAAETVFARRGYHGASVDEIAEEAGYSKGALYYNFATKEELFLALLDQHLESRVALIRSVALTGRDGAEQLAEGARRTLASLSRDRDWSLLFFEFAAHAARDERFRRRFVERLEPARQALVEALEAMTKPLPDPLAISTAHLALGINALIDGIAMNRLLDPAGTPAELLAELLRLLWHGAGASVR
jgi:AcrR family transcriptional regulator